MNTVAKPKPGQPVKTSFLSELFQVGLYKPNQGRIVRQVTFISVAIVVVLIAMAVSNNWDLIADSFVGANYVFSLVLSVIGLWFAYRIVNYSVFADFLIAVEAEMNKVSWPTWPELWKAAVVVMFVIFVMAVSLFLFDVVWSWLFGVLGVRYIGN